MPAKLEQYFDVVCEAFSLEYDFVELLKLRAYTEADCCPTFFAFWYYDVECCMFCFYYFSYGMPEFLPFLQRSQTQTCMFFSHLLIINIVSGCYSCGTEESVHSACFTLCSCRTVHFLLFFVRHSNTYRLCMMACYRPCLFSHLGRECGSGW